MKPSLLKHVDQLIDNFQKTYNGDQPLYIIVSPDERKALEDEIRSLENHPSDFLITTYRDSKIVENISIQDGEAYVSNDLPETGG